MSDADIKDLITGFKEANVSLRKRAVTIGVLTLLTIGLVYMESFRLSTVMDLMEYQYKLDKLIELKDSTFKTVIDGEDDAYFSILSNCNSCLERLTLFKKIKANDYDKKFIIEAVDDIDNRIDKLNEDKAISIFGFSIPIKPMYYVFFLIMLVLFHDFTQTLIYKSKVYKRIKGLNIPNWKLGFELFGFHNASNNPSLKFVRFTSSLISSIIIFCPFITCILMYNLPKANSYFEPLLVLLNGFCLVLIIVDTFVILYCENMWGFRYLSNLFLGKYRTNKQQMRLAWITITVGISIFHLLLTLDYNASFGFKTLFNVLTIALLIALYITVMKCFGRPSRFWRGARAAFLIINLCWFVFIIFGFNDFKRYYIINDFEYIIITWLVFFLTSVVIAFIYARWFMVDRFKVRMTLPTQPTE